MRDIVFFFGAGASYGAGGILPESPPLSFQLYRILETIYPATWGGFPQEVKNIFYDDFEAGMAIVYEERGQAIPSLMRELAIYFIQFRPYKQSTLYCRLVSDLKQMGLISQVAFSTLNYECVLEFSLMEEGIPINYFDYSTSKSVPIWKLHGSCNFFSQNLEISQNVLYNTGVHFEGGLKAFLDQNEVIEHCLIKTGLAPAMSLFMEGKPLQISPSVIKRIQSEWVNTVMNAKIVFCIGVRPHLADTHIWQPLGESPGYLGFVGEQNTFNIWNRDHRKNGSEFISNKFHKAYPTIIRSLQNHEIK